MRQVFIQRSSDLGDELAFERKLYVIRKRAHREIRVPGHDPFWYPASLSCRTLVYKGMLMPLQVGQYYPDLQDPEMTSALALVHSRFSTNTFPSWERSHPYRYIAHNGEINTCGAISTGCTRANPYSPRHYSARTWRKSNP